MNGETIRAFADDSERFDVTPTSLKLLNVFRSNGAGNAARECFAEGYP
jgi:hypothetical protein